MKEITLHNKIFEVSISDNEIAQIVDSMAKKINATKINDYSCQYLLLNFC